MQTVLIGVLSRERPTWVEAVARLLVEHLAELKAKTTESGAQGGGGEERADPGGASLHAGYQAAHDLLVGL